MEGEYELHLTVEAEDAGSASRHAQLLERLLLEECPAVQIRRIRTDNEKMDGGATLALALASPSDRQANALLDFLRAEK
jgi:hypothetical protein